MENFYSLLGLKKGASGQQIKSAFRDKAKRLHPDIAGKHAEREMMRILAAYEVLSDDEKRFEYDRAYERFIGAGKFDYRTFLQERSDDPASQAKLVFFELLHLGDEEAIRVWHNSGGLDFPMRDYLDREDWMDCAYLLAEALVRDAEESENPRCIYEAVMLLIQTLREERRKPYFKHFTDEVEMFLKELVRLKLRAASDNESYIRALEGMLSLGFAAREESRLLRNLAEALLERGENTGAERVLREALKRDPALPNVKKLRRELKVL